MDQIEDILDYKIRAVQEDIIYLVGGSFSLDK